VEDRVDIADRARAQASRLVGTAAFEQLGVEHVQLRGPELTKLPASEPRDDVAFDVRAVADPGAGSNGVLDRRRPLPQELGDGLASGVDVAAGADPVEDLAEHPFRVSLGTEA